MLFWLALVLVVGYAGMVVLAIAGWLKPDITATAVRSDPGSWTIVIPFRNEEEHLERLLQHLAPQPVKEIILVNDHSTDHSLRVINECINRYGLTRIKVLQGRGEGKKAASVTGLKAASTPWVFFTDADCMVPQGFFQYVPADAGFFYGPVVYGTNGKGTNAVFFLDQLALNGIAIGLGKTGIHTYCSGACMGGNSGALFGAVPVLENASNLSGDDVTYLQQAVRHRQKIYALTHRGLMVNTVPPRNMGEFLRQRLRWGQKAGGYAGGALPALSALVWSTNTVVLMVLIFCLSGILTGWWWAAPAIKLCIDLLFLFLVALRLRVSPYLWAFLPAWLLNLMYIPAIGLLGMLTNMTWKGRNVKRN